MKLAKLLEKGNNNFDLFRLISALMVIYGHAFWLANSNGEKDFLTYLFPRGLLTNASFAICFFFFLSGLLITNSLITKNHIRSFIVSRFFRIYPALFFTILISTFIVSIGITQLNFLEFWRHELTWNYLFKSFYLNIQFHLPETFHTNIHPNAVNGSLWSLPFEVACYLGVMVVYLMLFRKIKLLVLFLISFLIVCNLFLFNVMPQLFLILLNYFGHDGSLTLIGILFCFALGSLLAVFKHYFFINIYIPASLFLILFLIPEAFERLYNLFLLLSLLFLFLYLSSLNVLHKLNLKHDISYGVYLWGFFVQQVIYFYAPSLHFYLNIFLSLFISMGLGYLSFILIEHPAMKFGKRINRRWS